MASIYDLGLEPTEANYAPLTPLDSIVRTAGVYPEYPAVIHGEIRRNWRETYERCRRLASALAARGIGKGDTVSAMLPNIPQMLECHFGVPMVGAVLNALNTRLDAGAIAFMLEHGEARVLIVDREFGQVINEAVDRLDNPPMLIDVNDPEYGEDKPVSELDYEAFLAGGDPEFEWQMPANEWDAISLGYTSGTTGNPKGVVSHHRGAYENAMGNQAVWSMGMHPVYLWTLPMFHCNGWCFPWTITAFAGTHVCLRRVDPEKILQLIREHDVTHMCGAPIVLNTLLGASEEARAGFSHTVQAMTAGAAPPAKVIEAIEGMGIRVTHVYGLTEVYGPVTVCAWKSEWDSLPVEDRARLKARQGVRYHTLAGMMVGDPDTIEPEPKEGKTIREIFLRGNTVMKG
jgi:fatty-acyl-CoA synthase